MFVVHVVVTLAVNSLIVLFVGLKIIGDETERYLRIKQRKSYPLGWFP